MNPPIIFNFTTVKTTKPTPTTTTSMRLISTTHDHETIWIIGGICLLFLVICIIFCLLIVYRYQSSDYNTFQTPKSFLVKQTRSNVSNGRGGTRQSGTKLVPIDSKRNSAKRFKTISQRVIQFTISKRQQSELSQYRFQSNPIHRSMTKQNKVSYYSNKLENPMSTSNRSGSKINKKNNSNQNTKSTLNKRQSNIKSRIYTLPPSLENMSRMDSLKTDSIMEMKSTVPMKN